MKPRRIGIENDMIVFFRIFYDPKRQWCWLLRCIVMAALTEGFPSTCIVLEKKIRKILCQYPREKTFFFY